MQHLYAVQMIDRNGTPTGKPFAMQGLPFEGLLLKQGQAIYSVSKVLAHLPEGDDVLVTRVDVKVDYTGRRYF